MERVELKDGGFLITDEDYADCAQEIMETASDNPDRRCWFKQLSTSKLRDIYAQVVNANSKISSEEEFEDSRSDLQYLKVKMAYEAGRYDEVKQFLEESHLLALLDDLEAYDQFQLYCRYAESLVAYFKFYGGKE